MKRSTKILWGVALVAIGVLYGLKALSLINFTLFFDGWWTLFLIVPCLIGLITEREKLGNLIGLLLGVFLLLCCQDVLSFDLLWNRLKADLRQRVRAQAAARLCRTEPRRQPHPHRLCRLFRLRAAV